MLNSMRVLATSLMVALVCLFAVGCDSAAERHSGNFNESDGFTVGSNLGSDADAAQTNDTIGVDTLATGFDTEVALGSDNDSGVDADLSLLEFNKQLGKGTFKYLGFQSQKCDIGQDKSGKCWWNCEDFAYECDIVQVVQTSPKIFAVADKDLGINLATEVVSQ